MQLLGLNTDVKMLVSGYLALFWPVTIHVNDAFEKWPGSNSSKETAVSAWRGFEATLFEQVAVWKGGSMVFATEWNA